MSWENMGVQYDPCQHSSTRVEVCESGPHYAKMICESCGHMVRWLPKPENEKTKRPAAHRELVKKFGFTFCHVCLREKEQLPKPQTLHAHHIIEYSDESDPRNSDRENILCACTFCHSLIHHVRTYLGHYHQG